MKVSNCCGTPPKHYEDFDTEDFGFCPDCKEHCEYVEVDECGDLIAPEVVALFLILLTILSL